MSVSIIGNKCCACRTCEQICSVNAITLKKDSDGYEQVCVDNNVCIECDLCEKVCPILNVRKPMTQHAPLICGAAFAKDDLRKKEGSSGGLFGILSRHIISNGGVVYGAAFDKRLQLNTARVETVEGLRCLYKSKYLLCNTGDSFNQIRDDLKKGRKVLYCSTPCQIAGLQSFLRKYYENLICIEFACHGVGNQQQFDQSVKYLENKYQASIDFFEFRHKRPNASSSHYYEYRGTKSGKPFRKEGLYLFVPYYNAYCKQLVSRKICYNCPYASEERNADITIGDFHTIGKFLPEIDRFKGVSMFLCNTEKGKYFFESIKEQIDSFPMEWNIIKKENRFTGKESIPKERETLLTCLRDKGYVEAVKTILNPYNDWKRLVYYSLPAFIRNKITGQ